MILGSSVDYTSPHAGGRTILSVDTSEEDGFKGYTKLIVNCILYLLFFAWLLIKGEPRYPRSCKQLSLFKTFLKKADNEMKQVSAVYQILHSRLLSLGSLVEELPFLFLLGIFDTINSPTEGYEKRLSPFFLVFRAE